MIRLKPTQVHIPGRDTLTHRHSDTFLDFILTLGRGSSSPCTHQGLNYSTRCVPVTPCPADSNATVLSCVDIPPPSTLLKAFSALIQGGEEAALCSQSREGSGSVSATNWLHDISWLSIFTCETEPSTDLSSYGPGGLGGGADVDEPAQGAAEQSGGEVRLWHTTE